MGYAASVSIIVIAALAAAFVTIIVQRFVEIEFRCKRHDVGSVVFLQLGVVFAVLLAFVFIEAWGEYNEAAQAINLEVGAMHGVAMIAATLPPAQADTILTSERGYLKGVAYHEWPVMAERRAEDTDTFLKLQALIQEAANLHLSDPDQRDKKAEMLSLLAQAHAQRETRIFQANTGIPMPLWTVLIGFTGILALFVTLSAIPDMITAVAISACFTAAIASILVLARLFDYPFEGALALPPKDFVELIGKVSALLTR
jgi:hypothetical protein